MPYATNLPRVPRPRGLGALGDTLGAWVVDKHWGLSPSIVPGQNIPYGPNIVNTIYPYSQSPRYLDVDYGVIQRSQWQWPKYHAASGPGAAVFRMPVTAPGIKEMDGPDAYEKAEPSLSGYGYIPPGQATPPAHLVEVEGFGGLGAAEVGVKIPWGIVVLAAAVYLGGQALKGFQRKRK